MQPVLGGTAILVDPSNMNEVVTGFCIAVLDDDVSIFCQLLDIAVGFRFHGW